MCVLFVPDIVIRACDVEGDLHNVKRGGEGKGREEGSWCMVGVW